ncbi:hypothetical protein IGI04_023518 [Brassica rapa subsp. trilocularis]|uniref:BHLH domain-containing protein n=1 Tax=Brassica rapa subsp. trilocularis TaxID=1813537 RepID=A0ABQ7M433_BRACM|nr:hypothetical protein IGI04_023518 [Brassica rapa subsp. trilocularis]
MFFGQENQSPIPHPLTASRCRFSFHSPYEMLRVKSSCLIHSIRPLPHYVYSKHSSSSEVRREKISEMLTLLQDLVPGSSRITGKAVSLDEIIKMCSP